MHRQALVFLFLVYVYFMTVVSEDSCEFNQTCSATFVNSDIQLMGCPTVPSSGLPKSTASLNCLNNIQCKAIICSIDTCSTCLGDQVLSFSFNSSGTYLKRKFIRLNTEYDPVSLGMKELIFLPDGLSPGDLVAVKATPLKYDNFIIDFLVNSNNTNFHFRTRCDNACADFVNCTAALCARGKHMILAHKVNNQWSTAGISDNYPFKLNQQFELHILVLSDSVICYIDRKYYTKYMTPFHQQSVYGIRYRGTINVHEFSV